jgi:hypothetical protein
VQLVQYLHEYHRCLTTHLKAAESRNRYQRLEGLRNRRQGHLDELLGQLVLFLVDYRLRATRHLKVPESQPRRSLNLEDQGGLGLWGCQLRVRYYAEHVRSEKYTFFQPTQQYCDTIVAIHASWLPR